MENSSKLLCILPVLLLVTFVQPGVGIRRLEEDCTPLIEILSKNHKMLAAASREIGLPDNGAYTLLAPSDEAVLRFLRDSGITNSDVMKQPEIEEKIRNYNALLKPVRLSEFQVGQGYMTELRHSYCGTNEIVVKGYEDGHLVLASPLSEARIVDGDQIACGGIVVHTLDNILLPCAYQFGDQVVQ